MFRLCMHIIIGEYVPVIVLQKVKMFSCRLSENLLYLDGKTVESRCKRVRKAFYEPMLELHFSFYTATLPIFTHYKLFLQRQSKFQIKYCKTNTIFRRSHNKVVSKYFLWFSWEFTFFSCKFYKLIIWLGRRDWSKMK